MMHRHALEALDRTSRDIIGQIDSRNFNIPFGNKIIVFGGDFRQTLLVVKKVTRFDIIDVSFNRSKLWKNVQIMKLTMRIMRLTGTDKAIAQEFADFLIRIGKGTEPTFRYLSNCTQKIYNSILKFLTLLVILSPDMMT